MENYGHTPVLLHEAVDALDVRANGIYIDFTTGGASMSALVAGRLDFRHARLLCVDRDSAAINAAKIKLADFPVDFVNDNYTNIKFHAARLGITAVNGILMDLGVSSHQLDTAERGFSFHLDAPLDMRMSGEGLSAYDVVNGYSEDDLVRILFKYGEEKFARGITKGIIKARTDKPIRTTGELAEVIKTNVPLKIRREKNPCRKTFQAIRIEVNGELEGLSFALPEAFDLLAPKGRLVVITFHSLEDRIVKNYFRDLATGCTCPPDFPICVCGNTPKAKLITKKPIIAKEDEIADNNRSRSAKLRVIEKM
ncbi:MAG: 16S rRNA (cytosine(1402)-N(4))-methyltransferase RsmH [Oscillospiraceae bacterium]|nr:16S rRNA (cytosine(1402)-N(4))-methyltransferase RsmH [Oscillospiraceae bacterium]